MKLWLLSLLLLGVLLSAAWAEQQQPRKRREVKTFQEADQADDDEDDEEDADGEEEEEEEEYSEEEVDVVKEEKKQEKKEKDDRRNPCLDKTCRRGEICTVDKRQRARCTCIPHCKDPEIGDRYQVCSRRNVTYPSECALDRDHCLCRRQLDGCSNPKAGKIRLDYYGPCQELTPCTEREFGLFPGRMREWLFVIMQQMAQRAKIPEYMDLLEQARQEGNHSHAVIWKFCDLDVDPHDRFVTRRELLFTIQSLKPLEHCLIPFLDHCDTDTDGRITLWEWGRCLQLEEEKIKDDCKTLQKAAAGEQKR